MEQPEMDWVRAYNDLHWLLTMERAAVALNLSPSLTRLLLDLYGRERPTLDGTRRA